MSHRISSLAILSVHTCPFAALGGKKTGGMNVYIRELAQKLGSLGIRVDIFTRCESGDTQDIKRLSSRVKVIHISSGPEKTLPPLAIYPYLDEFTRNVLDYAKRQKVTYELIHAHYWLSGLVALALQKEWQIPVIQSFHTLGKVKNQFFPEEPESEKRITSEEKLVRKVDRILVSTQDEVNHLTKLYSANSAGIDIIPPGVDVGRFHPIPRARAKKKLGVPKRKKMILFVGRLDPIKGVEVLLQAIAILKAKAERRGDKQQNIAEILSLAIIGGEDEEKYFESIKREAEKLKIDDVTSFLGSRRQLILPRYYSASEGTIIPSSHESFGLVALESMACATPVIASNVGGLQHLIEHAKTGLLVPPENPKPLAEAIDRLLNEPKFSRKLGDEAHRTAQRYDWEKISARILALYRKTLQAKG